MILSYSRARRRICFLLYASGISPVVLRTRRRHQPLVLLAHRVLQGNDLTERLLIQSGAALSESDFERRIRFLARRLRSSSMGDYVDGTAGAESFVLTFDDGYRDNFTVALPILRNYRVPMHLFVTTGFVNGQVVSWVDRVARACSTAASGTYRITSLGLELHIEEPGGQSTAFDLLRRALSVADTACIQKAVAEIECLSGVVPLRDGPGMFLSPTEIAAQDGPVSFGAHSVTHANFRSLDRAAIVAEAEGSREWIEVATGRPVSTFAYPYGSAGEGARDYFRRELTSPAGNWRHVFATGAGRAGDPLEDHRLNLNLQPFYVFHVEVSGAWALLRRALRR